MSSTPRSWTINLRGKPLRPNQDRRGSWPKDAEQLRKQRMRIMAVQHEREDWQQRAGLAVREADVPHIDFGIVSAVYHRKVIGRADQQNDIAALKDIIDGFVRAGVFTDDKYEYVRIGDVHEEKDRNGPSVEVTITEAERK